MISNQTNGANMSRRTIRISIVLASILVVASSTIADDRSAPAVPDRVVVYKKAVSFKTVGKDHAAVELKLHIFHPTGHQPSDSHAAIVFFFSGGWNVGSADQFFPQCEYFASRGIVAMSAEYRVKSRHNTTPRECVKDAKSAIRWIRQNAARLGIDPNKLAAGGGSAGGHIAAATATVQRFNEDGEDQSVSCIPNALVLFNPAIDNGPKNVDDTPINLPPRKRAGWGYARVKEYWRDFSPMHNIHENTPPAIIFLGAKDAYISTATVEEFKQRMTDKGVRCDLHIYKNEPHEFYNYRNDVELFASTLIEADKFLASLGFLQGQPTLRSKSDLEP